MNSWTRCSSPVTLDDAHGPVELAEADVKRDPLELFAEFYQQQNHQSMPEE